MMVYFLLLLLFLAASSSAASFRLYGVNYSIRDGPDWTNIDTGRCKLFDRVVSELQQLHDQITNRVRIYSMVDCDTARTVLQASQQVGGGPLEVWLGLWAAEDPAIFDQERARFLELLAADDVSMDNVIGVHVSSEAIYREEITVTEAIALRDLIKEDLVAAGMDDISVTVADIIDTNLQYPQLITVDDNVVSFNQFPFWEQTTNINDAAEYMSTRVALVEAQAGGRQIIMSETGWADAGTNEDANPANPPAMRKWLRDFVCLADSRGWQYFWFTGFDNDWRRVNEQMPDDVEGHFGLFDEEGILKPYIANLEIDCSQPAVDIDVNGSTVAPAPVVAVPTAPTTPTAAPAAPVVPPSAPVAPTPGVNIPISTVPPDEDAATAAPAGSPTTEAPITSTAAPVVSTTGMPTSTQATAMPIASPTLAPMENVSTTPPTAKPTTTPVVAQTISPIDASTGTPNATAPTAAPVVTTATASPVTSSSSSSSSQCQAHAACSSSPLLDQMQNCCPSSQGLTLQCCDEAVPVQAACSANPQCSALVIDGSCCPAPIAEGDERYLDCCAVVPDACGATGTTGNNTCTTYSAVQYKLEQEAQRSSTSAAVSVRRRMATTAMIIVGLAASTAVL